MELNKILASTDLQAKAVSKKRNCKKSEAICLFISKKCSGDSFLEYSCVGAWIPV